MAYIDRATAIVLYTGRSDAYGGGGGGTASSTGRKIVHRTNGLNEGKSTEERHMLRILYTIHIGVARCMVREAPLSLAYRVLCLAVCLLLSRASRTPTKGRGADVCYVL